MFFSIIPRILLSIFFTRILCLVVLFCCTQVSKSYKMQSNFVNFETVASNYWEYFLSSKTVIETSWSDFPLFFYVSARSVSNQLPNAISIYLHFHSIVSLKSKSSNSKELKVDVKFLVQKMINKLRNNGNWLWTLKFWTRKRSHTFITQISFSSSSL